MDLMARLPHRFGFAARPRAAAVTLACASLLAGPLAVRGDAPPSPTPMYTVTDLGQSNFYSTARAINNRGQVVGAFGQFFNSPVHACLYDSAGIHDLGTLADAISQDVVFIVSEAVAINDAGQIVGRSSTNPSPYSTHAFLYDSRGMHDLGPSSPAVPAPDETGQSWATAINAAGQVVGTEELSQVGGFLWQNGVMQPVAFSTDPNSAGWAFSINASGQILCQVDNKAAGSDRTFIWQNGVTQDLPVPDTQTFAQALNDRGQVMGIRFTSAELVPFQSHAMLYDDTGWHDLGTLGGGWSSPVGMNNLGQIVGESTVDAADPGPENLPHPFLYTGGVMLDLEPLLLSPPTWDSFYPEAINDQGQIVGEAALPGSIVAGIDHAYLLTPAAVPVLSLSASTLDFSGQPAGAAQQVTLTNTGDAPLKLQGLDLTGADAGSFQIAPTAAATLAPGASQTVAITYTPATIAGRRARIAAVHTAAAARTAALVIHDNDPHPGAPHQVTLTALGAHAPPTPPAAPTNLTATAVPGHPVVLTWTDHSSNETAFALWRQTGSGPFTRIGVVAPNVTRFADATGAPSTAYTYEVRATNNTGASAWSNPAAVVTAGPPPGTPTNLKATVAPSAVNLTWTAGGGNATGIGIFRQANGGAWVLIADAGPRSTHYADRSAKSGTRYAYQLQAHSSFQVSARSNLASVVTPSAP